MVIVTSGGVAYILAAPSQFEPSLTVTDVDVPKAIETVGIADGSRMKGLVKGSLDAKWLSAPLTVPAVLGLLPSLSPTELTLVKFVWSVNWGTYNVASV